MSRLIDWPRDLKWTQERILSGPRTIGAATTTSVNGFNQNSQSPFGTWVIQLDLPPLNDVAFRKYRGWVAAMHGGANFTRFTIADFFGALSKNPDGTPRDRSALFQDGFGFGEKNQSFQYPTAIVPVAVNASKGDNIIQIAETEWQPLLCEGDYIGFTPFHFGMYLITEVLGGGIYRVTFPLREDITTDSHATLWPTLAMRLQAEDSAPVQREAVIASGISVTMIEVQHRDVLRSVDG